MLTEKQLLEIGEAHNKKENPYQVRVEEVKQNAEDAIVKIGRNRVAVSEGEDGIFYACGKKISFVSHGKWNIDGREMEFFN